MSAIPIEIGEQTLQLKVSVPIFCIAILKSSYLILEMSGFQNKITVFISLGFYSQQIYNELLKNAKNILNI